MSLQTRTQTKKLSHWLPPTHTKHVYDVERKTVEEVKVKATKATSPFEYCIAA